MFEILEHFHQPRKTCFPNQLTGSGYHISIGGNVRQLYIVIV